MKLEKLSVSFDSEKLRAIRIFIPDDSISIEEQLEEQLEKLYQKIVPPPARLLIEGKEKPQYNKGSTS